MHSASKQLGLTLVELITVLAVLGILLGFGIPAFSKIVNGNRVTAATNTLVSSISMARSEAVKRGVRVTVCKAANATSCTQSGDYSQGWLVFVDADNDATLNNTADLIRAFDPLPPGFRAAGDSLIANYISYDADGIAKGTDGSFQAGVIAICEKVKPVCVGINRVGRVRRSTSCSCTP